jgi:hypothetical protein
MNVYQIHLAMRMQHVATHKDLTSVHVIRATVVIDLPALVNFTQDKYRSIKDHKKRI